MSHAFLATLVAVALSPAIVFAVWLQHQSWEPKDKIAAWDPFIKTMGIAGTVVVGLAALQKYLDQRQIDLLKTTLDLENSRRETFRQAACDIGYSDRNQT